MGNAYVSGIPGDHAETRGEPRRRSRVAGGRDPCRAAAECHERHGTELPSEGPCAGVDDSCASTCRDTCRLAKERWQECLDESDDRSECTSRQEAFDACADAVSPYHA